MHKQHFLVAAMCQFEQRERTRGRPRSGETSAA
jgi:hypothetical protein